MQTRANEQQETRFSDLDCVMSLSLKWLPSIEFNSSVTILLLSEWSLNTKRSNALHTRASD